MKVVTAFALLVVLILVSGFILQWNPAENRALLNRHNHVDAFSALATNSKMEGTEITPATLYPVSFTESGLPSGTTWSVTLDGVNSSSNTNTISYQAVQSGTHSWTVAIIPRGQQIMYVPAHSYGNMTIPPGMYQQVSYTAEYLVSFATSINGSGTISPAIGSQNWYNSSSTIQIVATPNPGYNFSKWFASPAFVFENSTMPTTNVTVDGPGTITAIFAKGVTNTTTTTTSSVSTNTTTTITNSTTAVTNSTTTNSTNSSTSTTTTMNSTITTNSTTNVTRTNTTSTTTSPVTSTSTSTTNSSTTTPSSNETSSSSSNNSSTRSSTNSTSTQNSNSGLFYFPFVSNNPPSSLGLMMFAGEMFALAVGIVAILLVWRRRSGSGGSTKRDWRW